MKRFPSSVKLDTAVPGLWRFGRKTIRSPLGQMHTNVANPENPQQIKVPAMS